MKKQNSSTKTIGLSRLYSRFVVFIGTFPYASAVIACSLYLIVFQFHFVTIGDSWAESYAEYLDESVRLGWSEVVVQNWAGYFSIVPSFIAKLYVWADLPLGLIDYFFKFVVLFFSVSVASLAALKMNRSVVRSDAVRIWLSIMTIAILPDITSFSFINIWYLALIPLIFSYLGVQRFSRRADLTLGVAGALISLTKPFLITAPIILIRAIRSKQYVGPIIFLIGASVQAFQILFNDRRQLVESVDISIKDSIGGVVTGSGVALLKLFHIPPVSPFVLILALILLVLMVYALWRTRGWIVTLALSIVFLFSVYTYVLAPDLPAYQSIRDYASMYDFNLKTQREILVNGAIIISIALLIDSVLRRKAYKNLKYSLPLTVLLLLLPFLMIHRTIDVDNAGVSPQTITPFREDLTADRPSCIPIAPASYFLSDINWYYAHRTKCYTPLHDTNLFKPDFSRLDVNPDTIEHSFDAEYFRLDSKQLYAVVIPVRNHDPSKANLTLTVNGIKHSADTETREGIQFIPFRVDSKVRRSPDYSFSFNTNDNISMGRFKDTDMATMYLYYID